MADRLLVELGADGQVAVGSWLEGDLPGLGESCGLMWPLDGDALEDLRWYLEDYLRAPFGVYGERGPRVQARLAGWGEAVFAAVFGGGPARDAYVRMRARRAGVEVVFRSASPALLGLPWELMRDPGHPAPLALEVLGVSRSLPTADLPETFAAPGGRLRVLMVISRPAGTGDVGYRMIARPLLDRLEAVRGRVDLVVLRPPTLETLGEVLTGAAEAGEPFQVVHFDGHGALAGRAAGAGGPSTFQGPGPEGVLVFEKADGGPDEVAASRVAQVLAAARVPVVVLNACQSGAVGKELEAAVATRLLQEGIASVVAMAYTVYAVAAAEFMAAFYERLFAGDTVGVAVTAGRQRLFRQDLRPSPKGDMPLADWVVPVHYLRRDVSFPQARTPRRAEGLSLDAALDRLREPAAGPDG
ncbi:MAG TPA: CHAT domain-containing protein, partial [Streptosporangiaceae bacterium]|nr:CHAT domain-containing protein [Streptosporangiaceae bacterium]